MRESNPEFYKNYYRNQSQQKGGHLAAFHGGLTQRGHGLGSIFRGLYRWAIPHIHSGMKAVGQRALTEGLGVAQDVMNGERMSDSVKKRGKKAIDSLTTQNAAQSGEGKKPIKRKAKAKTVSRAPAKKRKTSPSERKHPHENYFD